jgi:predicted esterase
MLLLHGAGGTGAGIRGRLPVLADSSALSVVALDSRGSTWEVIRGPFGPDVAVIDSVLASTFAQYRVDRTRVTIAGFSDGASYALSLGLSNGDLFTRIVAFSPGMDGVVEAHGRPRIFISHGTRDQVLDVDRTSRRIAPRLRAQGYDVTYREFEGTHDVPRDVAGEALLWLGRPTASP